MSIIFQWTSIILQMSITFHHITCLPFIRISFIGTRILSTGWYSLLVVIVLWTTLWDQFSPSCCLSVRAAAQPSADLSSANFFSKSGGSCSGLGLYHCDWDLAVWDVKEVELFLRLEVDREFSLLFLYLLIIWLEYVL
jgi:hypothetical protein